MSDESSDESAGTPGGGGDGRRVRKLVRVRTPPERRTYRQRAKKFWSRNKRWLAPAVIFVLGLIGIWVSLTVGVRD